MSCSIKQSSHQLWEYLSDVTKTASLQHKTLPFPLLCISATKLLLGNNRWHEKTFCSETQENLKRKRRDMKEAQNNHWDAEGRLFSPFHITQKKGGHLMKCNKFWSVHGRYLTCKHPIKLWNSPLPWEVLKGMFKGYKTCWKASKPLKALKSYRDYNESPIELLHYTFYFPLQTPFYKAGDAHKCQSAAAQCHSQSSVVQQLLDV